MDIELKAFLLKQNERWEKMLPKTHTICEKWDDIIAVFDSDIGLLNFNNCPKLRVVFHFGMICADQIFDIAVLVQNESFSSIENILRAALESYGIFDLLMRNYTNDTTFIIINEYLKLLDLEQNFKILSAESKDTTSIKYKEGKIFQSKAILQI